MTEAEWLVCSYAHDLLVHLGEKLSVRKLRLFACACCRRHWSLMTDGRTRRAVEVAEKFADGLATATDLTRAKAGMVKAEREARVGSWVALYPGWALAWHIRPAIRYIVEPPDILLLEEVAGNHVRNQWRGWTPSQQADLLRHIAGNPWRPLHIDDGHPDNWHVYPDDIQAVFLNGPFPATVTRLAEALYRGEDCAFALHDVLLECGYDELAQHFREPVGHPKGCAWIDAILGKE